MGQRRDLRAPRSPAAPEPSPDCCRLVRSGSSPKVRPPRPSTLASASGPSGAASPSASVFCGLADFCTFLSLAAVSRPLVHSVCICCVSTVFIKRVALFPSDFVSVLSALGFCSKITSRKKKIRFPNRNVVCVTARFFTLEPRIHRAKKTIYPSSVCFLLIKLHIANIFRCK